MKPSTRTPVGVITYILALALSIFSGSALASFFILFENSVSNMGVAHAGGSAFAEDATTVWYNPAGMVRLEGSQLSAGAHLIFPSTKLDVESATISPLFGGAALTGGDGGDAGDDALVPHVSYTRPINDKLTFGLSVNAPFGLKTEYEDGDWVGRYHAIESEVKTININPAIGYKINDKFSVGGGISVQYVEATLTNAVDFGSICFATLGPAACLGLPTGPASPQASDGKAKLEADDTSLGANFGFLWQPSDNTRVGVHYRSAFTHELEGDSRITPFSASAAVIAAGTGLDSDIETDVTFPATISISAYHQLNAQWAIMGDVTQTRWGRLPELRIKFDSGAPDSVVTFDLDDVERFAVGTTYKPNGRWTYRFGIAFDESPTPNAAVRTPRLPDEDRIWYTFGLNYRKGDRTSFDFAYAFIDIDDARVAKSTTDPENLFRGNLVGEYEADVNILSAQLNWKFQTR